MDDRKASDLIEELRKGRDQSKSVTEELTDINSFLKQQTAYLRLNTRASEVLGISLKTSQTSMKSLSAGFGAIDNELQQLKQNFSDLFTTNVAQVAGNKFASAAMKELGGDLKALVPVTTANTVRLALFQAGLERNSESLSLFLARSEILGENLEQVTFNLRGLKNNLGLNDKTQVMLIDAVSTAAGTYKTSSESVLRGLLSLSNVLAVTNTRVNPETARLITLVQGMVDRVAPDALQTALEPLLTRGPESIRLAGALGVGAELQRLQAGVGSQAEQVENLQKILKAFVSFRDQFVSGDVQSNILTSDLIEKVTLLNLNQIETLRIAEQSIQQNKNNIEKIASINDAQLSVEKLMKHLFDGFSVLKNGIFLYLERLVDKWGPEALSKLGLIAAAVGVVVAGLAAVSLALAPIALLVGPLLTIAAGLLAMATSVVTLAFQNPGLIALGSLVSAFTPAGGIQSLMSQLWQQITGFMTTYMSISKAQIDKFVADATTYITSILPPGLVSGDWFKMIRDTVTDLEKSIVDALAPIAQDTDVLANDVRQQKFSDLENEARRYSMSHAKILSEIIKKSNRDLSVDMTAENARYEMVKQNLYLRTIAEQLERQSDLMMDTKFRWNNAKSGDGSK